VGRWQLEEAIMRLSDYRRRLRGLFLLCAWLVAGISNAVQAVDEPYPTRPIDLIVPWGPGGGADYIGRALGKELQRARDHCRSCNFRGVLQMGSCLGDAACRRPFVAVPSMSDRLET
jgi:hypothetical protein